MKSEGNLDVNAIEEPGHECFTFPLQSHNLLQPTTQQGASVPCNLQEGGKTKKQKENQCWAVIRNMHRPMKVIRVVLRIHNRFLGSIKTHLIDQQITSICA
jgi:hypothetical protein